MKIGLLTAMPQEASAYFKEARNATDSVMEIKGTLVRVSGIGKVNAALATVQLINAGAEAIFVGGVCATLMIEEPGNSYLLTSAFQYDYGIADDGGIEVLRPGSVPGEDRDSFLWIADDHMRHIARQHCNNHGRIATGDAFMASPKRAGELAHKFRANVLDMETAAVAQVCAAYGVPWIGFKTVTDSASHGSAEEFWANLPLAVKKNAGRGRQIIADLEQFLGN